MTEKMTIADLRKERGETLEQFATAVGLSSKGHASNVENSGKASLDVALRIEELSGGRIDAADLNDDVAKVRAKAA